ncbi:TPA: AAA family ATPase [Legionella pneumophila]|nr:AAA family ATPase [Legionella pneumophila]
MVVGSKLCTNFFIFTGGPGSGKTVVLNELNTRGYLTVAEAARSIIQKQQADGGDAIHTRNRKAFRDLMLEQSIADYCRMQSEEKIVFFDRGIPDLYGYSKAFCGEASKEVNEAVRRFRYNKTVFIFPPWPEIYENDDERQQDYQEALQTYYAVKEGYVDCGYALIEVPKHPVKDRADFIFQTISKMNWFVPN